MASRQLSPGVVKNARKDITEKRCSFHGENEVFPCNEHLSLIGEREEDWAEKARGEIIAVRFHAARAGKPCDCGCVVGEFCDCDCFCPRDKEGRRLR